jgi:hypothetical protein
VFIVVGLLFFPGILLWVIAAGKPEVHAPSPKPRSGASAVKPLQKISRTGTV